MTTKFNMTKDVAGYNGFGLPPCDDSYEGLLAKNVADSVTTPSQYPSYLAVISYTPGKNVFVDCVTTAAAPAGAIGASSASLNPAGIKVTKGTTISFITPDTGGSYVNIRFFAVAPFGN